MSSDLSIGNADDMAISPDLAAPQMPLDMSVPADLQPVCDTDANQHACNGVCLTMSECCTPADCPTPANGTATCDSTSHACGVSCSPGYRGCGALCIPSDPDDGGMSPTGDGGTYNNACCVDSDCPAAGEVCPAPGAACGCPTGQTLCSASNSCIPNGNCCTAADCPTPTNGTATCTSGTCGFTCNGGFNKCGSSCAPATDQCCMTSDCPANHDSPACISGTCGGACDPGWTDCDGNMQTNGCETNTGGDTNNCGTCGHVCSSNNGTPTCSSGTCQIACTSGFGNCDGSNSNGCETNTNTDTGNCGSCGQVCSIPNGTPSCVSGGCQVGSCNAGFADCDSNPADGCEINIGGDTNNCGSCGHICMIANGSAACIGGTCGVAACNPGWADCDGLASNGCETNLNDPSNCGTCGHVCSIPNGTAGCAAGVCTVASCDAGRTDCNNDPNDGCETNTNGDPNNCGSCGHVCSESNGTAACSNGNCTIASCNSGFADCNGSAADGCETNTRTDNNNCGSCGNKCAADCSGNVTATSCSASICQIAGCAPGYTNLDGQCADGCECHINTPSTSCGAPSSLGFLSVGQQITVTNNLIPTGTEGYYSVTMTGNTNMSYHPHVVLSTNPSEYVFDVKIDCSGNAITCGNEGGVSNGVTDWETFYTGGDPTTVSGQFLPIPPVGSGGTILIHVYRRPGAPTTCNSFTLTISN